MRGTWTISLIQTITVHLYCCCLYCTIVVCINEIVHVPLMFSDIVLLLSVLYCCCLYCTVVFCINDIVHVPLMFSGIVMLLSVLYCCCLYCTVVVCIVLLLSLLYCCCLYCTVVCINEIVHVPLMFSGIVLLLSVLYCCCLQQLYNKDNSSTIQTTTVQYH
jgi:predicted metallopeptidase